MNSKNPSSAHWYGVGDLTRHINTLRSNRQDLTITQFVRGFAKLNRKTKAITEVVDVSRLSEFEVEDPRIAKLLDAMQQAAPPPKPSNLRFLGEDRIKEFFGLDHIEYKRITGSYSHAEAIIPYSIETAFAYTGTERKIRVAINGSPAYEMPFDDWLTVKEVSASGLNSFLEQLKVERSDPVTIVIGLTCPNPQFSNKAKTKLNCRPFNDDLAQAVYDVCKAHYKAKKRAEKEHRIIDRPPPKKKRTSIRQAAFEVIPEGVAFESDGGRLRFNARHLWYCIEPLQKKLSEKELTYSYFTPQVLTDYQEQYGEIPLLYYEARGYLLHPHSQEKIYLDTLAVNDYKLPDWTFDKLIYIEKEGSVPVLEDLQFLERYDAAVLVAQGFATRAIKKLIDKMFSKKPEMRFFTVHDCDASGINIYRTLQEATHTAPARQAQIIDLGLRPRQVWDMDVEEQEVSYRGRDRKKPPEGIKDILEEDEYSWIFDAYNSTGHKVEIDQIAPRNFVAWIESELARHDADTKLIPPETVVEKHFIDETTKEMREQIDTKVLEQIGELLGIPVERIAATVFRKLEDRIDLGDTYCDMKEAFQENPPQSWRSFTEKKASDHADELIDPDEVEEAILSILRDEGNPDLLPFLKNGSSD